MAAYKLVLASCLLSTAAAQAAEPSAPSAQAAATDEVFLAGDTCALEGALDVVVRDRPSRTRVPKGSELLVTTSGARFSAVRAGSVTGMVENEALARVCKIERPTCLAKAPLELRGLGRPKHEGEAFQLQQGGSLRVLRHDAEQARVRVGQRDAMVPLATLLAACPSLAAVLVEKGDESGRAPTAPGSSDQASSPTKP